MEDKRGIRDRLWFAERRLSDLKELETKYRGLGSAPEQARQQPLQEFFDHLVGAIEFLAQEINEHKRLGFHEEDVTPNSICNRLTSGDPIKKILTQLHPTTKGKKLPQDPYSDAGSHFRIMVFRNRVTHHGRNPLNFRIGVPMEQTCSLFLDPREEGRKLGASSRPIIEELNLFLKLVKEKCEQILVMS